MIRTLRNLRFPYVISMVVAALAFWVTTHTLKESRTHKALIEASNATIPVNAPHLTSVRPVVIYLSVYVYRPGDVSKVLRAAREGIPELGGTDVLRESP